MKRSIRYAFAVSSLLLLNCNNQKSPAFPTEADASFTKIQTDKHTTTYFFRGDLQHTGRIEISTRNYGVITVPCSFNTYLQSQVCIVNEAELPEPLSIWSYRID